MRYLKAYEEWLDNKYDPEAETLDQVRSNVVEGENEKRKEIMAARERYMRNSDDPNFKDNLLEVSDEIEILISQIKMILLTDQGDILGAPDFGMSLESLLFTFDANAFTVEQKL